MSTDASVPVARPSSTVVLVRVGEKAPEILLVRRHVESSYGGAYVFPGGVVDPADRAIGESCLDVSMADANRLLNVASDGLGFYVAAIRELFEESGVLLAKHALSEDELHDARCRLNSGALEWNRFVADTGLKLRCDALRYFGHWITPDVYPKRYTTRFFLTRMPDRQVACHDDGELTDALWTTAATALGAAEDGELSLHFPTIKTIEQLAAFKTVDEAVDWAGRCERDGVDAVHPVMPGGSSSARPRIRRTPGDIR